MSIEHDLANEINEYFENNPEENKVIFTTDKPINLATLIENRDKKYIIQQLGNLILAYRK